MKKPSFVPFLACAEGGSSALLCENRPHDNGRPFFGHVLDAV